MRNLDQIDVAVDLGISQRPLPPIIPIEEFEAAAAQPPPQLIAGILHQGCKMVLGGTSKANKSWTLLDLALSVSSGQHWWGRPTVQTPVVYLNFELHPWSMHGRLAALRQARPECHQSKLHLWNLRGFNADLTTLRPKLEQGLADHQFGLIVLDPAYKLLGDREENSNEEIANLMNEFEALASRTGAAIVIAHHFGKGDSTAKSPIDRLSGAGVWARDPDAIMVLTPHEENDCYTVSSVLRNLPFLPEFVVKWQFPLMTLDSTLNPDALRRPINKQKVCSDREFLDQVIAEDAKAFPVIMQHAREQLQMSRATAARYLQRLVTSGVVHCSAGLYWKTRTSP